MCGRPLQSLFFVEVFAGSARLAAAVHKTGIGSVFGIDAWIPKSAPAPIVKLDLQLHEDVQVLFMLLDNRALAAVHLAPPASLPSRGSSVRLRSSSFPDGTPGLLPVDADKVFSFNQLYALSSVIFVRATQAGILATLENPASSYFWQTSAWLQAEQSLQHVFFTLLHTCMFGASFKRQLRIAHCHPTFSVLEVACNHPSEHPTHAAPWDHAATYPNKLCQAYALALSEALLQAGAQPPPQSLLSFVDPHLQARIALGTQPRGKRVPALLPEHKAICVLVGPASALPTGPTFAGPWLPSSQVSCQPPCPLLPAKTRVLAALPFEGSHEGDSHSTFCDDSLHKGDFSSSTCLQVLAQSFVEPLEARRPGVLADSRGANYFVLGAYKCLPRIGVTNLTRQHLSTASFINSFLMQRFPGATWSAFVMTHNEASALHVDTCNVPGSKNFAVGLGSYVGGELFIEAPGGSVPFLDDATGEWLWGEKRALNLEPCTFDGFARHATLPWEGDRWTIIAYSAVSQGDLASEHEQLLLSCGFPLPWCQPSSIDAHRPETKIRMTVGVPWEPRDFAREAARRGHPKHLFEAVPPVLKAAIDATLTMSEAKLSQHRTEVLRRWMLRAQELESKESQLHASMPKHLAKVLKGKRLLVLGEMLVDSGYGDAKIASEIGKGFDLTGPIPSSGGLFKQIVEPATMTRECLRAAAPAVRSGILQATAKACASELAQEIHEITQEEVTRGWLSPPVPIEELGDTCSLSRRFGVVQSSAGKRKVRPIDNLSESFINSTVSRVESIQPHGLDVVCAAIAYRLRVRTRAGKQSVPMLKIIDLLKAYKQLGLSEDALQDGFLCVPNPVTGKPCVHMCHVLPFGAAASVAAFCRSTMSLWYLGCATLLVHWTVFYDDFIVVNEAASAKHCELVLRNLWSLLGWSVAQDKETEFDYFARALGIKICFHSEQLFVVENTPERKAELEETIMSLLELDWVDQHALTSLRGRLQFVEGQIHGRRSHRHMQLLSRRAEFIGGSAMDDDLRDALRFLLLRVVGAPPRVVSARRENSWFLFTDAAYECSDELPCGIGAVLVAADGKPVRCLGMSFGESLLDGIRFWENSSPIYFLEGLAVIAALHRWDSLVGGSEIVCFVDNEAAKSAFIATKTPSVQFGLLLEWLAAWEERHSTFPWFERVSSAANIADGPSRDDFGILLEVQRDELDLPQLLLELQCSTPELATTRGLTASSCA